MTRPARSLRRGVSTVEYVLVSSVLLCALLSIVTVIGYQTDAAMSLSQLATVGQASTSSTVSDSRAAPAEPPARWSAIFSPSVIIVVGTNLAMLGCFVVALRHQRRRRAKSQLRSDESAALRHQEQASRLLRTLRQHVGALAEWELLAEHVMDRDVVVVRPKANRGAVQQALHASGGVVMVCDTQGTVLGSISDDQFAQRSDAQAGKLMEEIPVSVDAATPLSACVQTMLKHHCLAMPILQQGRLVGLLTHVEVGLALQASLQLLREIEMQHRQVLMRTVGADS